MATNTLTNAYTGIGNQGFMERNGIQIDYGAGNNEAGMAVANPLQTESLQVESHSGEIRKTSPMRIRVEQGTYLVLIVRSGTLLIWNDAGRRWTVVPPLSISYVPGPTNLLAHMSRGTHKFEVLGLSTNMAPYLASWLDRAAVARRRRSLVSMAINPIFRGAVSRLDRALARADRMSEPVILGLIHEVLPRLSLSEGDLDLAPLPPDLPANIKQLTEQVKQKPEQPWPLKDAADFVGYSPFHFSRVYKQFVGYGFHEFVDRCRTESAVQLICSTDTPIDLLASQAGFGTTQALRESIKEYLGLVPSELRAEPEGALKS